MLHHLGQQMRLLILHITGPQLPPQGPSDVHAGNLLPGTRNIDRGQMLPSQLRSDPQHQLRQLRQGHVEQRLRHSVDDGCINLTLAQHKGTKVFAASSEIFEMLTGGLPVGTAHDRREFLQGEQVLTAGIDE
jgi:hypothetical protein